jgi:hypothetical protein
MGSINLPPTFFDHIKLLENRITKLENFNRVGKAFAMATGTITITPVANTPTSAQVVMNPSPFGAVGCYVYTSANTSVPGSTVLGTSGTASTVLATNGQQYQTTLTIYVTRTNTSATSIRWLAIQMNPNSVDSGW